LSGAIFGTIAHNATLPLIYLTNLGKAAYMALFPFFGNAAYMAEDHLVKNLSPTGLSKKFKENYWPNVKKSLYTTGPIMAAASLLLPQQFMVTAIAVANYVFRKFVVGGKGEEQTDKTPYLAATSNVVGKLAKTVFYGVPQATYSIARTLGEKLYSTTTSPVKTPSPTKSPESAHT